MLIEDLKKQDIAPEAAWRPYRCGAIRLRR
jgi:hypothetical protein